MTKSKTQVTIKNADITIKCQQTGKLLPQKLFLWKSQSAIVIFAQYLDK